MLLLCVSGMSNIRHIVSKKTTPTKESLVSIRPHPQPLESRVPLLSPPERRTDHSGEFVMPHGIKSKLCPI